MSWRHRVDIDLVALRHNIKVVRKLADHQDVIAVVKANAFGLGIEQCAPIYDELGVSVLAVASVSEAQAIRELLPQQRILILGPLLPHEHDDFVSCQAEIMVSSKEEVEILGKLTQAQSINVHLDIDTGMGRNGCSIEDCEALLQLINGNETLHLAGISTHYPQAYDDSFSTQQEKIFDDLITKFHELLPIDCLIHRANSAGLIYRPPGPCNAVRVGLLLTGASHGESDIGLEPVVKWSSAVALVKNIKAKQGVSYNHSCHVDRDSRIAIIPVGYADGLPIHASNSGQVLIHGHRCPILGQVTMDYVIVDVTDIDGEVLVGDEVILIGEQGAETISIAECAHNANTIPYDILCGLRGRGQWHYHDLPHS